MGFLSHGLSFKQNEFLDMDVVKKNSIRYSFKMWIYLYASDMPDTNEALLCLSASSWPRFTSRTSLCLPPRHIQVTLRVIILSVSKQVQPICRFFHRLFPAFYPFSLQAVYRPNLESVHLLKRAPAPSCIPKSKRPWCLSMTMTDFRWFCSNSANTTTREISSLAGAGVGRRTFTQWR